MGTCSCLLSKWSRTIGDILAQLYFNLITYAFWFVNIFVEKKTVPPVTDPILLKSVRELREDMRKRQITSTEIINSYINRIEEVNPIINAIAFKNYEEARELAKLVDKQMADLDDGQLSQLLDSKPLLGLPYTLKDSIMVKGKPCTVGLHSRVKANEMMSEDAVVIERLKNAGGIFLAITTVPESVLWIEAFTKDFGRTNNPYDTRRIVGGSSGGQGALTGAGGSLLGLGSDIGGSVRIPAFMNGIFGIMCSPKKVPLKGHIPDAPDYCYKAQMARIGPMTRFAEDLPLLCDVLSGGTVDQQEKKPLKDVKIYYLEGITHNKRIEPQQEEPLQAMKEAVQHFEEKYGITAQCVAFPETDDILNMYGASIFEEGEPHFSCFLSGDLVKVGEPKNCYLELLKALFGQSDHSIYLMLLCIAPWWSGFSSERHKELREKRDKFTARVRELLGDNGVIFYPGWQSLPQYHYETIFKQTSFAHCSMINMLTLPAVQCPMGLEDGVPTGVMAFTNQENEKLLFDIAQEISDAFGGWVNPGDIKKLH